MQNGVCVFDFGYTLSVLHTYQEESDIPSLNQAPCISIYRKRFNQPQSRGGYGS